MAEVDMATYILKNLFNKFSKRVNTLDNEEKIYFKMEEGVNRFSPYLANGTAGVLMILLIYKQKFNSSYWEDEIQKSIKLLKESKMPKAGGMYYGLAGIIYSLIIYNKIYKNKNLNYVIRTMLTNLQFYTLDVGTNLFLIDGTFADINVNFSDGNMGLIKVIEMTERLDI
ncbi:lanthionine synthetase LanC family protein [Lactobacillus taiwanensis]|uniref:lanthionine synthetase LanC family protein n=1 Tax=Lactobacillus taiwanensis TaxID=508451 RepID=UPI0025B21B64|nr:lanthionine synthetase LanC family protein [Lactobacillus taiwanensis]